MPTTEIRSLEPTDWDDWRTLWAGYLDFYRVTLTAETTRATFDRLCRDNESMFGLVALDAGDVGRDLIVAAKQAAEARGADRLYWHTQQYNGRARSLYDQVGHPTSFVVYEM
jgi:hypothetical protein